MRPTHTVVWRKEVEPHRLIQHEIGLWDRSFEGENHGAFKIPYLTNDGKDHWLCCIASLGDDNPDIPWDHVSVHAVNERKEAYTPTWDQMCHIKKLFFLEEECCVQFHPPKKDHINYHPHTLHLWRSTKEKLPMPPWYAV